MKGWIIGGFPIEELGIRIIWVWFVDVAEAMAFTLGVIIDVVDVIEGVGGVNGGFDGDVEGERVCVHCSAAFAR